MTSQLDQAVGPLETSEQAPCASYLREVRYGSPDYDDHAPVQREESIFRHSGWAGKRRRILEALRRTGQTGRRILNFCDCGGDLWVKADGQELVLVCNRCHDRLCDPCQAERRSALVEQILLRVIDAGDRVRFVTFTLKHHPIPLSVQIDKLISSFKNLRRHPTLKRYFESGAWFLEIKLDKAGVLWHPHLHVIQVGPDRIPHREISQAWLSITGDSFVVDVRAIPDRQKQVQYVTKYATKPLATEVTRHPALLQEFVVAIKGRRLYQCFGTWAAAQHRDPPTKRELRAVGALCTIHREACEGAVESLVIMHQLHARWPRLRRSHPLPPHLRPNPPPHA